MEKFKLSFEDPKYIVNGETVICKLEGYSPIGGWVEATGVAYLLQGDSFILETGKRVAKAKAELQCFQKARANARKRLKKLTDDIASVNEYIYNLNEYIEHDKVYLNKF